MRRLALALFLLAFPATVFGQQAKEKPVLVLDTGGHSVRVAKVLFTPDSKQLISVSFDKTIRIWDVDTGACVRVLRTPAGVGKEGELYAAALSPDGKTLAVAGSGYNVGDKSRVPIYVIALESGAIIRVLQGHTDSIVDLAYSKDGTQLASAGKDRAVRLWDPTTGKTLHVLAPTSKFVKSAKLVAFSPDGTRLATHFLEDRLRIWSTQFGKELAVSKVAPGQTFLSWKSDGTTIFTSDVNTGNRFFDADGLLVKTISDVPLMAVRSDFRFGLARPGKLWNMDASKLMEWNPSPIAVVAGAFSADGKLVAGVESSGNLWIGSTTDHKTLHRLNSQGLSQNVTRWSKDGKSIAWFLSGASFWFHWADLVPGKRLTKDELEQAAGPKITYGPWSVDIINAAAKEVKKDGVMVSKLMAPWPLVRPTFVSEKLIAGTSPSVSAGYGAGQLVLLETTTGKLLRKFVGHASDIFSISPSPDGRYLLTGSSDRTVRIWKLDRDEPLVTIFFARLTEGKKSNIEWIAWTPEGFYAASTNGERFMGWHIENGTDQMASYVTADRFRKQFYRPDVISRLLEFGSLEKALEAADKERGVKTENVALEDALPPTVTLLTPAAASSVKEVEITVSAKAVSQGKFPITELQMLLDGRPVEKGLFTVANPKLGAVEARWTVKLLPGVNRLQVAARTRVSSVLSEATEVNYVPMNAPNPKNAQPRLYLLSVGVNSYPGDWKLYCAANDARGIKDVFEKHSKKTFGAVQASLLVDGDATGSKIVEGLQRLKKQMRAQDVAVIFFAGHGVKDTKGMFYLCPVDTNFAAIDKTGVSNASLKKHLADMPGRIVVMLDACHSGASRLDELARDLSDDDCGVVVMCAATGREVAGEQKSLKHGYFALALIEGLSGKADVSKKDGQVWLHHLESYVFERVQELSEDEQHPTTGKPSTVRSFALAKP